VLGGGGCLCLGFLGCWVGGVFVGVVLLKRKRVGFRVAKKQVDLDGVQELEGSARLLLFLVIVWWGWEFLFCSAGIV